jgi:hypothetical protein
MAGQHETVTTGQHKRAVVRTTATGDKRPNTGIAPREKIAGPIKLSFGNASVN